jgi:hypothetical protein
MGNGRFKKFCEETGGEAAPHFGDASGAAGHILDKMGLGKVSLRQPFRKDWVRGPQVNDPSTPGEHGAAMGRSLYRTPEAKPAPVAAPQEEPQAPPGPSSYSPWPTSAEVNAFKPKKGEFGYGVKTPDFYNQAQFTSNSKVKISPEEERMIADMAAQGKTPLGISLELGDKLNKTIPAAKIHKLLAQMKQQQPVDLSDPDHHV